MENINDIKIYNNRMDASIDDKLWFINRINADIYVDFGCANGNLLKTMYQMNPHKTYIGYDNNIEMIKIAWENCEHTTIEFMPSIKSIKNFNLSKQKEITYKIIINILREDKIYDVSNNEIENYIKNIKNNPNEYLLSLNPNYELNNSLIANKKSLNF